jgi:hypothetical protein
MWEARGNEAVIDCIIISEKLKTAIIGTGVCRRSENYLIFFTLKIIFKRIKQCCSQRRTNNTAKHNKALKYIY